MIHHYQLADKWYKTMFSGTYVPAIFEVAFFLSKIFTGKILFRFTYTLQVSKYGVIPNRGYKFI